MRIFSGKDTHFLQKKYAFLFGKMRISFSGQAKLS